MQERDGLVGHTDRAAAGTAAAVGRRERLVEIEVHDVEAHVARPDHAQQRVHVGAVVVEQAAAVMDQPGDFPDVTLEEAQGVGVREHDAGDVRTEERLQRVHVHEAVLLGLDDHDVEAADGR